MNREKQIEEIAKILCGMKNGCDGCMWDKVHCNERNYAEDIYNAGYRKQKEGEWIEHETAWGDVFYSCSVCGDERCAVDGSVWELGLNFCPNCGAKMKGGAE